MEREADDSETWLLESSNSTVVTVVQSNLHSIRTGIRVLRTVLRGHRPGVRNHLVQSVRKRVHAGDRVGSTV